MYTPFFKNETTLIASMNDAPAKSVKHIPKKLVERLGSSVSQMFPVLARCFPLTVASMEAHWSAPKVAVIEMQMGLQWVIDVFLEKENLNLFFDGAFTLTDYDAHPDWIEDSYGHLPPRWFGLYHSMSSFVITPNSNYSCLGWRNTPLSNGMRIDTFSTETHTKKSKLKAFAKQLGAANELLLRCYLLTDAHDSLWVVDDERCDRKVYHVKADRFEEAFQLPDPENTLDECMAHVVAGGQPADFDFRVPKT